MPLSVTVESSTEQFSIVVLQPPAQKAETAAQAQGKSYQIAARVDISLETDPAAGTYAALEKFTGKADVVIDFSHHTAAKALTDYCIARSLPVVIATTGQTEEELGIIRAASAKVPVFLSANMSLGINILAKLIEEAAGILAERGYDIEIVERHHNQKLDAPSGTAIMLADAINDAAGGRYEYIYDRSQHREKRDKKELGISAVRGGNIPGTHEIIFAGPDEVIELRHVAYSRSIFGNGALSAAKYLAGRKPGLYDMNDVIAAMI